MADPCTGAAIGVLFAEVVFALKKAIDNAQMFRPRLQQIHSSVTAVESRLKEMTGFDKQLNIHNDELRPLHDILEECKRVTLKCLKVKLWNFASVNSQTKKLLAMDERLCRYCSLELQLIIARDGKAALLKFEEIGAIIRKPSSSSSVVVDLALGALVGALIAELLPLKQAMETSRLGTTKSRLESLKPQIEDQISTFNKSQLEELRPIHDLLRAGLGLINKCRKYQFWDKELYSTELVNLDNGIRRLCQVDLVGILIGDVKINNTMDVSQLIMDEMARVSVLIEKDKAIAPFKSISTNVPELMARLSLLLEEDKTTDVPPCPDFVVGRDFSFEYIKEKLLTGEEPVIVIAGGRGYGKTTLVTKLGHDEQVKEKYKDIIFVVASEAIGLMAVIQKIVKRLRRKISDPDTLSEDDAVQILQQLVAERGKEYHILLLLDDLWSGAESILEKFVNKGIPNFTVLVTSRSELPGRLHQLKGLEHEDAVKLLRHVAIPSDCNLCNLPDDTTIDKVVERCKGSPLALRVVGKSLCGKDRAVWEQKVIQWSNGMSLFGNDDQLSTILSSLMYSLKGLDGTEELGRVKNCFLDLGSFPENHRICVTTLIDIWSELYNMGGSGMDAVAAIMELSVRRLVDLVIKREPISLGDGYYNDIYVMQTDTQMRELTIHLNSEGPIEERERLNLDIRNNMLPEWMLLKQSLKARLVSIYTDEHFKAAAWPDLELRNAEVLVLNFRATENYTLPDFIKNMENLKALIVINNGGLPVEVKNFHVIASLPNLKKMRLENVKIASLDFCLENLEKISAFLCDISEGIPTSDNLPFPEVYPKLEEIDISYCVNLKTLPYEICDAATLKTISVTYCHQLSELPEDIGNLSELQVLRLNDCTDLKELPDSICDLISLNFLDISSCCSIDELPKKLGRLRQLRKLNLSLCMKLSSLPSSVSTLRQLECLIINKDQDKFRRFFNNHPKLKIVEAKKDISLNFMGGSQK